MTDCDPINIAFGEDRKAKRPTMSSPEASAYLDSPEYVGVRVGTESGYAITVKLTASEAKSLRAELDAALSQVIDR